MTVLNLVSATQSVKLRFFFTNRVFNPNLTALARVHPLRSIRSNIYLSLSRQIQRIELIG